MRDAKSPFHFTTNKSCHKVTYTQQRATGHTTETTNNVVIVYIHKAKGHQPHCTNKNNFVALPFYCELGEGSVFTHYRKTRARATNALHWLSLRDKARLPKIKQHLQLLTLKKIPQIPLPDTRPRRRGQQISLATLIHPKTSSLHPHPTTPTTSRHLANTMLRHHSAPTGLLGPCPGQRIGRFAPFQPRHGLRRDHIQRSKIIQILIRRLFSPRKRTLKLTHIRRPRPSF
jgi:hypothetical protein